MKLLTNLFEMMLEINFLQEDNDLLKNPPVTFKLLQLENNNYVLSNSVDYYRLKSVLKKWQAKNTTMPDLEEKYNRFLESNQKIVESKPENYDVFENRPQESPCSLVIDSFALQSKICEDFTLISDTHDNELKLSTSENGLISDTHDNKVKLFTYDNGLISDTFDMQEELLDERDFKKP